MSDNYQVRLVFDREKFVREVGEVALEKQKARESFERPIRE